jgi:hypothetical protein
MSNLIFTNRDKFVRAGLIVKLVLDGKSPKTEGDASIKERHLELLKEQKVDLKKEDAVLLAVYKNLGGSVQTPEQAAKIKARFKKAKAFAQAEKVEEEGPAEKDEEEDEEESDDE